MTTFSKIVAESTKNLTCKDFIHPDFDSCLSFLWFIHSRSVIRNLKYLAPIFLVPLIVKLPRSNIDEWKESAQTYLKMVLGMTSIASSSLSIHCVLSKIFKEVRFSIRLLNLCAVPSFIGVATFVNFLPRKFANLQFLFINNLLVQTIFRTSDYKIFRLVRESKLLSTILFMSFSSLIMGLMAITVGEKHRYWYAQNNQTTKYKKGSQDEAGEEKIQLKDSIYKQLTSTVKVGLVMSSFKILSNSIKLLRKSLFTFIASFLCNFDYKLLGFFIMYGTSFQIIFFLLNQISKTTNRYRNNFLAGFLAGTTFYLSPRYFLFTYAFTTFIELLLRLGLKQLDQNSKITNFLKSMPWLKIFFCLSVPTFAHWRIANPWLVPKFINELLQILTNDRLAHGSQNYAKHFLGI